MENQIQTAYVLADQDAPCTNSVKYGIITPAKQRALKLIAILTDEECIKLEAELNKGGWV